ncbi:exported hypothetical protein [Nitrospina gracilis 3/211]|uniref:Uncharacterized protein n=1 Tax=Nitrospina gracilis (strain 3/211) TaxID=1266370 RepID=M1YH23_NITG3|nr:MULTISPECIES: hypothetical protein [Nitrospina]MCF8722786.1 hypothetical protein [Nitrospina sp. Nb-3]CCQ89738.1 exported hypothetical protein [Nitrospina gracilis 3/211]
MKIKSNLKKIRLLCLLIGVAATVATMPSAGFSESGKDKLETFSSIKMKYGDLSGFEIRIVATPDGYKGTFQFCLGEPSEPLPIQPAIKDKAIFFKFEAPNFINERSLKGTFKGHFNVNGMRGTIQDNWGLLDGTIILPRSASYWD